MKKWLVVLGLLAFVGCEPGTSTGDAGTKNKSPMEILNSPNNDEIVAAVSEYFVAGEPVSKYQQVLSKADEVTPKEGKTVYVFYMRGKRPLDKGDGTVEVIVDETSKTIDNAYTSVITQSVGGSGEAIPLTE